MPRVTTILRKGRKALQDSDLLKILQSEINHEISSYRFQNDESDTLVDFVVDYDSPCTQDVVLRKKCESGEELAVSALLAGETFEEDYKFPREVLMKVCIRKPSLSSILQFDCGVSSTGQNGSDFAIRNAYYLQSPTNFGSSLYRGPLFSDLDARLRDELKQYLITKGISKSFTNFLLLHLHKKEQGQYMNWLRKLESLVDQKE